MLLLLALVLLTLVLGGAQQVCNYVVNSDTGVAWATEACIPWNARDLTDATQFIKYSCATDTDNDTDTVYVQFHSTDNCTDQHTSRLNMKDYVSSNSSELLFDCSGFDGCFVSWIDYCNVSAESDSISAHLVFSPLTTCVSLPDDTSFWMDCDEDDFVYRSFPHSNECSEISESLQWSVSGCSYVPGLHYNEGGTAEYAQCQPRPTLNPTQAPSTIAPSAIPTVSPTKHPTIYIPWYNRTVDEIIHDLEGDGDDSSADRCFIRLGHTITTVLLLIFLFSF